MTAVKKKKIDGAAATTLILMCWLAYSFSYVARLNFSATMAEMTNVGVMTKADAGVITTVFFLLYGGGQFLSGWLGDRVEPRLLIFVGLLGTGACNMAMSLAPQAWLMAVIWGANGLALSLLWAPIVRLVSDRIHSAQRGKACTALATTMAAGTLGAYLISAGTIELSGWSAPFKAASYMTLAMAFLWMPVVSHIEKRADSAGIDEAQPVLEQVKPEDEVPHAEVPRRAAKLFAVSGLWLLAIAAGTHGVLKDCVSTWVPTFLTDEFGMSTVTSILTGTLLPLFGLGGPYLANYIFKRKMQNEIGTVVVLYGIATAGLAALALFGKYSQVLSIVALALTYTCSIGMNMMLIGYIPMYFHKVGRVAQVTGIMNAVACLSTALASLVIGFLVDGGGWSATLFSWLGVAVLGGGACLLAQRRWSKFRRNLF